MTFADTEKVAEGLIEGLGAEVKLFTPFSRSVRLHLEGVCGVASIAIMRHLEQQGIPAKVVISEPNLEVDPGFRHSFVVASIEGSDRVIDASYTSPLNLAGLTPGYVMFGGPNKLPTQKIAEFQLGQQEKTVTMLGLIAWSFMENYVPLPDHARYYARIELAGKTDEEIEAAFHEVWNPENIRDFDEDEFYFNVGTKIAAHIDPADAKLVA